ncbi:MAG: glycosyltransferase family 2 protein [Chloroflexi bacterium]|nr:glycosyltransferase family 2 protein [Chloroflexota bacterium]
MPGVSVVLPAYNEEENIPKTVAAVVHVMDKLADDYEVIVVDDGSRDRTAEITTEISQRFPVVKLVRHPTNSGYGAALATGFAAASKELVFLTDADHQFDIAELSKLLPYIGEADLVIGYRAVRRDPLHRRLNGFGWNLLVNILFGHTARDVDCAFKLFRREILDHIHVESRGATFSTEFLVRARRKGYRVVEVPVTHLPRLAGNPTGARLSVILRAFRELIRFRLKLSSQEKNAA